MQKRTSLALIASLSLFSSAVLVACSNPSSAPTESTYHGSRTYKLDPEAGAVRVSVYGAGMGTPDAAKFELLLKSLKSNGDFKELHHEASGIEGGFTMCAEFSGTADQTAIYGLLRSIETDPKETHFSAVSVAGCDSQSI